jgi:pimeloyl-ACP methyl ester carboxylesterase
MPEIGLSHGTVDYRDQGTGDPVVLIHGVLVNGRVWQDVVPLLSAHARCIVPDLPLGSHSRPMDPGADLTPRGLADLIAEMLEGLGLENVTLVGNDTGGALCQIAATEHPERIGRLVLTNCDAFEHFPPPAFRLAMKALARVPGAVLVLAGLARLGPVRRGAMSLAPFTVEPVGDELLRAWVTPLRRHAIRRDLIKVLRGIAPEYTLEAAEKLPGFERPVKLVWGTRDRFFPLTDAQRLASLCADAELVTIDSARAFVQLDAPARLAEIVLATAPADTGKGG